MLDLLDGALRHMTSAAVVRRAVAQTLLSRYETA
jgi:hypothetical protein